MAASSPALLWLVGLVLLLVPAACFAGATHANDTWMQEAEPVVEHYLALQAGKNGQLDKHAGIKEDGAYSGLMQLSMALLSLSIILLASHALRTTKWLKDTVASRVLAMVFAGAQQRPGPSIALMSSGASFTAACILLACAASLQATTPLLPSQGTATGVESPTACVPHAVLLPARTCSNGSPTALAKHGATCPTASLVLHKTNSSASSYTGAEASRPKVSAWMPATLQDLARASSTCSAEQMVVTATQATQAPTSPVDICLLACLPVDDTSTANFSAAHTTAQVPWLDYSPEACRFGTSTPVNSSTVQWQKGLNGTYASAIVGSVRSTISMMQWGLSYTVTYVNDIIDNVSDVISRAHVLASMQLVSFDSVDSDSPEVLVLGTLVGCLMLGCAAYMWLNAQFSTHLQLVCMQHATTVQASNWLHAVTIRQIARSFKARLVRQRRQHALQLRLLDATWAAKLTRQQNKAAGQLAFQRLCARNEQKASLQEQQEQHDAAMARKEEQQKASEASLLRRHRSELKQVKGKAAAEKKSSAATKRKLRAQVQRQAGDMANILHKFDKYKETVCEDKTKLLAWGLSGRAPFVPSAKLTKLLFDDSSDSGSSRSSMDGGDSTSACSPLSLQLPTGDQMVQGFLQRPGSPMMLLGVLNGTYCPGPCYARSTDSEKFDAERYPMRPMNLAGTTPLADEGESLPQGWWPAPVSPAGYRAYRGSCSSIDEWDFEDCTAASPKQQQQQVVPMLPEVQGPMVQLRVVPPVQQLLAEEEQAPDSCASWTTEADQCSSAHWFAKVQHHQAAQVVAVGGPARHNS